MTIGIVCVACLAASTEGEEKATMTSGFMRTSSAASAGMRSSLPSPQRTSSR